MSAARAQHFCKIRCGNRIRRASQHRREHYTVACDYGANLKSKQDEQSINQAESSKRAVCTGSRRGH